MKTISILKYAFTLIGAAMLIGAIYSFINKLNFLREASTASGTVIELVRSESSDSVTFRPVVEFKTQEGNSIEFISSYGSNPPSYSTGEVVEVLYLREAPQEAQINGFFSLWGGVMVSAILGGSFFLVGSGIILFGYLKGKKIKYLKQHGVIIQAEIKSVGIDRSLKVNGRSPYLIRAQWRNPKTSKIHMFRSDNIWFDPSEYIDSNEINVFIEKGNPKKYHVDTSFLPKLAN